MSVIPKKIHYCWFGKTEKPEVVKKCMESWKKFCPDYDIIEWNEENSPMNHPWIKSAYKYEKYAFVADCVRFYALYNEGGIYLDTDMLLVQSLNPFLDNSFFIGMEDEKHISMGIIGSVKGLHICKECLEKYDRLTFDIVSPPIISSIATPIFEKYGFEPIDKTQRLPNDIIVYHRAFFYPIRFGSKFEMKDVMSYRMPETYAIHLWNKSWTDEFELINKRMWRDGLSVVMRRIRKTPLLPFRYWKTLLKSLKFSLYQINN